MKTSRGLRLAAIVAALVFIFPLGSLLPIGEWTVTLADRLRGAGAAGVLLFTAAYVVATDVQRFAAGCSGRSPAPREIRASVARSGRTVSD